MSKYWDKQGKFETEFSSFTKTLMPMSGPAETLGGELVRAANKLYYDAFNNGFCNNTSGAINFIKEYLVPHYRDNEDLLQAISIVEPNTNSDSYGFIGNTEGEALDLIVDQVALFIINKPELATQPSPCDMFDLQDDDFVNDEDEDYEDDYYYDSDDEFA